MNKVQRSDSVVLKDTFTQRKDCLQVCYLAKMPVFWHFLFFVQKQLFVGYRFFVPFNSKRSLFLNHSPTRIWTLSEFRNLYLPLHWFMSQTLGIIMWRSHSLPCLQYLSHSTVFQLSGMFYLLTQTSAICAGEIMANFISIPMRKESLASPIINILSDFYFTRTDSFARQSDPVYSGSLHVLVILWCVIKGLTG